MKKTAFHNRSSEKEKAALKLTVNNAEWLSAIACGFTRAGSGYPGREHREVWSMLDIDDALDLFGVL